jgi:hypothetical protein
MKLNPRSIFWAVAFVSAASYAVCAAFVAVAPQATSHFFSWVMHVDLSGLARHITWSSFLGGVICYSLVLGVLAWGFALAYNRLVDSTTASNR